MVVRVFALLSVVASSQSLDNEDSSLLQYNRGVQKGSLRELDNEDEDAECIKAGKCKPVTTSTTTPLPFIKKQTCNEFQCPDDMLDKPKPPEECDGAECTPKECCAKQGTCGVVDCSEGFHSNGKNFCGKLECGTDDCCEASAGCGEHTCLAGHVKLADAPSDCDAKGCSDEQCCGKEDSCDGFKCAKDQHSISDEFCGKLKCTQKDCCAKNSDCDDYKCPANMLTSPNPPDHCGGKTCSDKQCCAKQGTCAAVECGKNYHSNGKKSCGKLQCGEEDCCVLSASCDDHECIAGTLKLVDAPDDCGTDDCTNEQCCGKEATCDGFKCAKDQHSISDDFCGKLKCTQKDCCAKNSDCDDYKCPANMLTSPKPPAHCGGKTCSDKQCCVQQGTCANVECGNNFHSNGKTSCGKLACGKDDCCAPSASCQGHECPTGTVFLADAPNDCDAGDCSNEQCCGKEGTCDGFKCGKDHHSISRDFCGKVKCTLEDCCAENTDCDGHKCPPNTLASLKPPANCGGKTCSNDQCCVNEGTCADVDCGKNFHSNGKKFCGKHECDKDDCCAPSASCEDHECKDGTIKLADSPDDCGDDTCKPEQCCGKEDTCDGFECAEDQHSISNELCGRLKCTQRDCCAKNSDCDGFKCPADMPLTNPKPPEHCGGKTCSKDQCCAPEFVYCDSHTCSTGYEKNMRRDSCKGGSCTDAECCDKQVKTTTTTTKAPPAPPPPPAPCGAFTCPAGQRNACAGMGGAGLLSRHKPVSGSCQSRWGSFHDVNSGSSRHWHACDNSVHDSWLSMDLGSEYAIGSMMLEQGSHYNYGYRQLQIFGSTNGHQWFHVRTDNNGGCGSGLRKHHNGWPHATRFVKVKFGGLCGGNHFAIRHWEIRGEQANGCTAEKCCKEIPPPPKPSCLGHQCPAGFMRSNTGVCESGTCSNEQCCEKSLVGHRMTCKAHGDPHVETFDGVYAERLGQDLFLTGDFFLVNAPNIQIQSRLTYSAWPKSSIGEIMMKGDALNGKLLNIKWDGTLRWGNQQIGGHNQRHHHYQDAIINIQPSGNGNLLRFMKDPTVELHFDHQRAGGSGLLDLAIYMNKRPGVRGFCGNMNGNQRDDGQFVNHRASQVPGGQSLWNHPMEVEVKPPVPPCDKAKAGLFCEKKMRIRDRRSDKFDVCVFDYCIGGEEMAAKGQDFVEAGDDDNDDDDGKGKKHGGKKHDDDDDDDDDDDKGKGKGKKHDD